MITYKIRKIFTDDTNFYEDILKNDNESVLSIPKDPANTDYQAYLQFLADGGEPLPADEPEGQTA
jgi:hypothetical protein